MAMLETAVHEDAGPVLAKYQVRMSRLPLVIESVSESSFPQPTSHYHLWLCILITDSRHVFAALLRRDSVHIDYDIKKCLGILFCSSEVDVNIPWGILERLKMFAHFRIYAYFCTRYG